MKKEDIASVIIYLIMIKLIRGEYKWKKQTMIVNFQ